MKIRLDSMNLADGAIPDLFESALKKVEANIRDPSTIPTTTRKITIEVQICPDESRSMAAITVSASTSLAHVKPVKTAAILQEENGRSVLYVNKDEPQELPGNVLSITKEA